MKKLCFFFLLLILILAQDKFGEPDDSPKDGFKFLKKMNLPGYNPTVIVNKPPLSKEYKSHNIIPYGVWNDVLNKEKNKTTFFIDKNNENIRTSRVDFNEDKIFKQFYPEEFKKINWIDSLPKNNIFVSRNNRTKLDSLEITGSYHNYPQSNYFYSTLPNYQPVPLPKIENEPVIFLIFFNFINYFFFSIELIGSRLLYEIERCSLFIIIQKFEKYKFFQGNFFYQNYFEIILSQAVLQFLF